MKFFKSVEKFQREGELPLELWVEAEEFVTESEKSLPASYGYLLLMLAGEDPNFSGCLTLERNTVEELRDALTELLETYP